MTLRWIAQKLHMGSWTYLSNVVNGMTNVMIVTNLVVGGPTNNLIGGRAPQAGKPPGNVIAGNGGGGGSLPVPTDGRNGIEIGPGCNGNLVIANLIGTDNSGQKALANAGRGLLLDSANFTTALSNTISGNIQDGAKIAGRSVEIDQQMVLLTADFNLVSGNSIGTDVSSTKPWAINRMAFSSRMLLSTKLEGNCPT